MSGAMVECALRVRIRVLSKIGTDWDPLSNRLKRAQDAGRRGKSGVADVHCVVSKGIVWAKWPILETVKLQTRVLGRRLATSTAHGGNRQARAWGLCRG